MNRKRNPLGGLLRRPMKAMSHNNRAVDAYVNVLYSGFNVAANQSDYQVFNASKASVGALLTNLDQDTGIPVGVNFWVQKIIIRATFTKVTTVTAAVLAEAKRFLANSNYYVGWQGKSDYGVFPIGICMGTLPAVGIDPTNNLVNAGDQSITGEIKLPQPLPIQSQWNIASRWEYLLGKSNASQQGGGVAAQPVSQALVDAGFLVRVHYEGIWQRVV